MKTYKIFLNINALFGFSASAFYLFQTGIMVDKKKIYVLKDEGKEVSLPPVLKSLVQTVLSEIKFESKSLIQPFMSRGLDPMHSGFPQLGFQSFVGIPQYFVFDDKSNIRIVSVVNNIEFEPGSPEEKALDSSLRLSEKAKKFAIAQEIYDLNHSSFYIFETLPIIFAGLANGLLLRTKSSASIVYNKSPIGFCMLVSAFSIIGYFVFRDIIYLYKKADINYKIAQLSGEYIEGGIEYFGKMWKRNRALKSLNSDYPYLSDGDIPQNFNRANVVKLKTQIKTLKELLKDSESKTRFSIFCDYFLDNVFLDK